MIYYVTAIDDAGNEVLVLATDDRQHAQCVAGNAERAGLGGVKIEEDEPPVIIPLHTETDGPKPAA